MMSKTVFILAVLLKVNGNEAKENMNASGIEKGAESSNEIFNNFMADVWLDGTDMVKVLWRDCTKTLAEKQLTSLKKESLSPVMHCIKRKTLMALDRSLSSDVIPLGQGVQLVRFENINPTGDVMRHAKNEGKTAAGNATAAKDLERGEWKYMVLERMAKVFNTHVLKLDIINNGSQVDEIAEFRHRRRHHMVQMMMFGIMSMGMILVPMGFQFLAVLGGKAMLLAKLALILTSIQGLKKVATSPLNYGLYHTHQPTSFDSSSTFEKRGHGLLQPAPAASPVAPTDEWHKADDEITKSENTDDKIKYRFDRESKVWTIDSPKTAKRSPYNIVDGVNIYPVYAVSPSEGTFDQVPSQVVSGYPTGAGVPMETYRHINNNPTEIQAEYTIDFPVNKFQLKSSSPIGYL